MMKQNDMSRIVRSLVFMASLAGCAGARYQVRWKGSTVLGLEPKGPKVPLYTHRASLQQDKTPLCPPRYP